MKKPAATKKKKVRPAAPATPAVAPPDYSGLLGGVGELLETARRASFRTVNALMTATYWEVGRRIIAFENHGRDRAKYGDAVVERLAEDLTSRFGRGFGRRNVFLMRAFYLAVPQPVTRAPVLMVQTPSALSESNAPDEKIVQTASAQSHGVAQNRASSSVETSEAPVFQTPSGISETLSRKSVCLKIWQTLSAKSAALEIRSTPSNIVQTASGISPQLGKRTADEPNAPSLARRAQRRIHHLVSRIGPNASSSPLVPIAGRVLSPA
jgi:hypothetical protein